MKALFFISLAFLFLNVNARRYPPQNGLLGSKECTWGPSYWCSNLTAAAGCHAVKHCIQTVWEHSVVAEDTDSVCQTCLSMVKQARDQLQSNETQEEIKEVFEGSCKLIPLKIVNKECMRLADEFIPELVDTLASQMNPQVVCSVAGLCNNVAIDKLLEQQEKDALVVKPINKGGKMDTCGGCHKVVGILEDKFHKMDRDHFLQSLLQVCGRMSSLSDACSNIIVTYFSDIYTHMQSLFKPNEVCLMSGECSATFHVHDVEITPLSDVGVVSVDGEDLPCDLCKQLVGHLRDLLVANTTESEFQRVLQGICKQTKGFKQECTSIVDEYYPVIYNFLVTQLNSTAMCSMIGICPAPGLNNEMTPIMPLFPVQTVKVVINLTRPATTMKPLVYQKAEFMQLPIERLTPSHLNSIYNVELCTFCEYFLHYAQQEITSPKTENQIKAIVDKACNVLPSSINETCLEFIDTYGDAMVALLAQEIDPATICPLIQVCPSKQNGDVELFMKQTPENTPNCPLCLFAVTKLKEMVKDKKTEADIKNALSGLCSHLSGSIAEECQDFVSTYTDELVEMLVNDFEPQEVCVYLKLCKDNKPASPVSETSFDGEIETNEIPDFTANGVFVKPVVKANKPQCIICEFIMEKVDSAIEDKHTEIFKWVILIGVAQQIVPAITDIRGIERKHVVQQDDCPLNAMEEIKGAILDICNDLPSSVRRECDNFVNKYADAVLQLVIATANPKEICTMMKLCESKSKVAISEVIPKKVVTPQCKICKMVLHLIDTFLDGKLAAQEDTEAAVNKACSVIDRKYEDSCDAFLVNNGVMVVKMLMMSINPNEICSLMMVCEEPHSFKTAIFVQILPENVQYIDSPKAVETAQDVETPLKSPQCVLCKIVLTQLETLLAGSITEDDVKNALNSVCSILPRAQEDACDSFVDKNGPMIIKMLVMAIQPSEICSLLMLCQEGDSIKLEINRCAVCETTVLGIDRVLQNPKIDHSIEHVLEKACRGLTVENQLKCENLIESYGHTLLHYITHMTADSNFVCKEVGLCGTQSVRAKREQLLGKNKCTSGPGYWCESVENAQSCGAGANKHCQEKVWKGVAPAS